MYVYIRDGEYNNPPVKVMSLNGTFAQYEYLCHHIPSYKQILYLLLSHLIIKQNTI